MPFLSRYTIEINTKIPAEANASPMGIDVVCPSEITAPLFDSGFAPLAELPLVLELDVVCVLDSVVEGVLVDRVTVFVTTLDTDVITVTVLVIVSVAVTVIVVLLPPLTSVTVEVTVTVRTEDVEAEVVFEVAELLDVVAEDVELVAL
jgi:hypothetical protein